MREVVKIEIAEQYYQNNSRRCSLCSACEIGGTGSHPAPLRGLHMGKKSSFFLRRMIG